MDKWQPRAETCLNSIKGLYPEGQVCKYCLPLFAVSSPTLLVSSDGLRCQGPIWLREQADRGERESKARGHWSGIAQSESCSYLHTLPLHPPPSSTDRQMTFSMGHFPWNSGMCAHIVRMLASEGFYLAVSAAGWYCWLAAHKFALISLGGN